MRWIRHLMGGLSCILVLAVAGLASRAQTVSNPSGEGSEAKQQQACADKPQQPRTASWLDLPMGDWNNASTAIPAAPASVTSDQEWDRCPDWVRRPSGAMEQGLAAQGWRPFGQKREFEKLRVIQAMSSLDGMCRPMNYQAFLFQGRRFVGTIAPSPMDSRTDGALDAVAFPAANHIKIDVHGYVLTAYFRRYKAADAACCPSAMTTVNYVLVGPSSASHLVARTATTTHSPGN